MLQAAGLDVMDLDEWPGFEAEVHGELEQAQTKITALRVERDTYKHERQVKAEAQALMIIRGVRAGELVVPDREEIRSAYFISYTRALDEVEGAPVPITIRPEAALHFVSTLRPTNVEETNALAMCLMAELVDSGLAIIDRRRIQSAFSPLIDLSRQNLEAEVARHESLIAERYGDEAVQELAALGSVDVPLVLNSLYRQEAEFLAEALSREKKRVSELSKKATLTDRERDELDRLRAKHKVSEVAGRSRKRAAESRRSRRKRKK